MSEIKIKVGASADETSLRTVFRPLVEAALLARQQIMREMNKLPKAIAGAAKQGAAGASKSFDEQAKVAQRSSQQIDRAYATTARASARLAAEMTRTAEGVARLRVQLAERVSNAELRAINRAPDVVKDAYREGRISHPTRRVKNSQSGLRVSELQPDATPLPVATDEKLGSGAQLSRVPPHATPPPVTTSNCAAGRTFLWAPTRCHSASRRYLSPVHAYGFAGLQAVP